jgi:hypothetical protein
MRAAQEREAQAKPRPSESSRQRSGLGPDVVSQCWLSCLSDSDSMILHSSRSATRDIAVRFGAGCPVAFQKGDLFERSKAKRLPL